MSELKKILYADDEPDLRKIITKTLRGISGYEVKDCSDGAKALREVDEFKPDLVLLDVMMPVMTGGEALEALRKQERTADLPVIFITAKARPQDIGQLKTERRTGVVTNLSNRSSCPSRSMTSGRN
ncbi:response regulator [Breoghania sp.]|uniref:response regulator n=1 Tax=Breoghania sp. TaxID=2065378 RepID=UPI00261982BE|nr:response regulator [Breoghania sp.]MDJ0933317.1 response regulator [Breoghania sp.]